MSSAAVLAALDPGAIIEDAARADLDSWPDERLVEAAAAVICQPRHGPPDSFVLHAPLELLARRALLARVLPEHRGAARLRIAWLAASYERADAPSNRVPVADFADVGTAGDALRAAIGAGDLDGAEAVARWLGRNATAATIVGRVADSVLPMLSAAGHASIFLFLLPRVAGHSPAAASMLAATARELAREPQWRIEWIDHVDAARPGDGASLTEALLETPALAPPEVPFIYPLMHQVDITGTAQKVIGPVVGSGTDPLAALRRIQRAAALSMLQDTWDHAPYGWTHCLTLSQAAAGLAALSDDPLRAVRVGATHVVGFRSALSDRKVTAGWVPTVDAPDDLSAALAAGPQYAAAHVLRRADVPGDAVVAELASRAAIHPDAHLAKYTVACLDAASLDPEHRSLYVAAAAYLSAWWAMQPTTDDPILS